MKYINKLASVFFMAALALLTMTSCEGGDLYNVGAPDWLAEMGGDEEEESIISVTPNPNVLGATDNTTPWWTVFTDDYKTEAGKAYQIKFMNYGGSSNWNNFVLILRNEAKDFEYAVLRADNWGWGTGYTGEESDAHFSKKIENENRDWGAWAKAMSLSKCTMNLYNNGDGTADVKITMLGADGNTYTQEYTGISVEKDNLYFSFTVDNSHVEFGDVDVEDSEPTALTLNGVPSEVVVGTEFSEFIANVTATVTFAEGVTKDVTAEELQFEVIPDFVELGQKTLVAIYNKTYMGNNCSKPVVASKTFSIVKELSAFTETVVVPTPLMIGLEDNTTPWWSAFTDNIKVAPKETKVVNFTNYTAGDANYKNFVIILNKADNAEYGVVRADSWGWGAGIDGNANFQKIGGFGADDAAWAAWRNAMNGAKCTANIVNNGDGTADIKIVMHGTDGKDYTQDYLGINTIDPDNLYFRFTCEGAHLVFDNAIGATDNTTPWWSVFTPNVQVPAHTSCTVNFINYTAGDANYKNFVIILNKADNAEYGVVRADSWGWGAGIDGNANFQKIGGFGADDAAWAAWRNAMNGAKCTANIVNNGDGTADIKIVMHGTDGKDYTQDYLGINTIDPDNFYFRFTCEGAHLVFE